MNPLSFVTSPITSLWDAVARPFQAVFVVGLCYLVNQWTAPANPWWHWVALGMGIAVLVAWLRAAKTILILAIAFYVGRWIWRTYGDAAKARFDAWMRGADGAPAGAVSSAETGAAPAREPRELLRLIGNDPAVRAAGIVP